MSFVKLDCGILDSTVWLNPCDRNVFITALLMAEPREYLEPIEQLHVDRIESTGWSAPPGWYGYVPAAGPGIVRRALMDPVEGMAALARMGAPDIESRTQDFGGRRLIRVDGGYVVLNFQLYRDRDYGGAERSKRYRDRIRQRQQPDQSRPSRVTDMPSRRDITQAEAEAEAEKTQESEAAPAAPPAPKPPKVPRGTRLPPDFTLTDSMAAFARSEGLAPQRTFDAFCDYWHSRPGAGGLKLDWMRTWQTWCRTESDKIPGRRVANGAEPDAVHAWDRLLATDGTERDGRAQRALEVIGGYSRIKMRTAFDAPRIKAEFLEAYRGAAA